MKLMTLVVGVSCLMLMALFVMLFAVTLRAAAHEYYESTAVSIESRATTDRHSHAVDMVR